MPGLLCGVMNDAVPLLQKMIGIWSKWYLVLAYIDKDLSSSPDRVGM